ncbi:hypothetical protein NCS52_01005300 [Fusarium sp. LHS14.1]|nr:hypothetical protein NCS52_01005300 [Fusarium sp. LHS14.1]
MSEELFYALRKIAKRFREPEGNDNARFGHLALPRTHLASEGFLGDFLETFGPYQHEDDYRIFVIVSEFEKQRAEKDHSDLFFHPSPSSDDLDPSVHRPILLTFPEFVTVLESNRSGSTKGESGWKAASQPCGWNTDQVLPDRVVVFFNIQPCLPTPCALALLDLIKWASDVSERPSAAIRILTASDSDIEEPIVSRLVKLLGDRRLECFDISHTEPPASKPIEIICGEDNVVSEIMDAVEKSEPSSRHVILSYRKDNATELEDALETEGVKLEVERLRPNRDIPQLLTVRDLFCCDEMHGAEAPQGPWVRIIILEPEQRPLMFLRGYTHAHIILSSSSQNMSETSFDRKACQIANMGIEFSQDICQNQIAWSHQPLIENVFVYAGSTLEDFSRGGARHLRFIEREEAGSFIASVFARSSWGFDPRDVLECFQFDTQVYLEMEHRLLTQKIIEPSPPGLAMTDHMASVFRAILPIAKYDYRIAYFIANPASCPLVLHVKIQIAAMLIVGLDMLLVMENDPPLDELLAACWGYGRSLASTGTIWLLLGLWKRLLVDVQRAEQEQRDELAQSLNCSILNGRVWTTTVEVDDFRSNVKAIRNALAPLGLQVSYGDVALEDGDVIPDQRMELQNHLLLAYVHQLVVTSKQQGKLRHIMVSTGAEISTIGIANLPHVFDIERMMAGEDRTCWYSVCDCFLRRADGELWALHWTGIPSLLVGLWKLNHAPGGTLVEALDSFVPRP